MAGMAQIGLRSAARLQQSACARIFCAGRSAGRLALVQRRFSNASQNKLDEKPLPHAAKLLGVGGVIPFAACAAGCFVFPESAEALSHIEAIYSCSILSFIGGVHWGFSLSRFGYADQRTENIRLAAATLPSLVGAFSLAFIPHTPIVLVAHAASFAAVFAADAFARSRKLIPQSYYQLRILLSSCVIASIGLTIVAIRSLS